MNTFSTNMQEHQLSRTCELVLMVEGELQRQLPGGITWSDFLAALTQFCEHVGWQLEFGDEEDGSCAIFSLDTSNLTQRRCRTCSG